MPLFDHRVFKDGDSWWVAQVHMAGEPGPGAFGTRFAEMDERLYFTEMTNPDSKSRTASIRAGHLNRMSHRAICNLLNKSEPVDFRFDMAPYNSPSKPASGSEVFTDANGLDWSIRPSHSIAVINGLPQEKNGVEVRCLHDSALNTVIGMQDECTYDDMKTALPFDVRQELAAMVESSMANEEESFGDLND